MKKRLIFLILIFPISVLCQVRSVGTSYQLRNDTLKSKLSLCALNPGVLYNKILNLNIESTFIIIDSLKSRLNNDFKDDYIYILSNKFQEEDSINSDCERSRGKRLFVMFLSKGEKYGKPIITENLILNNFDFQSNPFRKITSISNGFKVSFYIGTRIRYSYDGYFKSDEMGNFFLYKLLSSSYDIHKSDSNHSKSINYKSSRLTRIESLNINKFVKY